MQTKASTLYHHLGMEGYAQSKGQVSLNAAGCKLPSMNQSKGMVGAQEALLASSPPPVGRQAPRLIRSRWISGTIKSVHCPVAESNFKARGATKDKTEKNTRKRASFKHGKKAKKNEKAQKTKDKSKKIEPEESCLDRWQPLQTCCRQTPFLSQLSSSGAQPCAWWQANLALQGDCLLLIFVHTNNSLYSLKCLNGFIELMIARRVRSLRTLGTAWKAFPWQRFRVGPKSIAESTLTRSFGAKPGSKCSCAIAHFS